MVQIIGKSDQKYDSCEIAIEANFLLSLKLTQLSLIPKIILPVISYP